VRRKQFASFVEIDFAMHNCVFLILEECDTSNIIDQIIARSFDL
jgi:hypothetical protein